MTISSLPAHTHSLPNGDITSIAGQSQSLAVEQPTLTVRCEIAVTGTFPARPSTSGKKRTIAGPNPYIGEIRYHAALSAQYSPNFMDLTVHSGDLLAISHFVALFSVLGTQYGGNGMTTFALPDVAGRILIGAGQGPGLTGKFGFPSRTHCCFFSSSDLLLNKQRSPPWTSTWI